MKGNEKLVDTLNVLLTEELTAINQYLLHAEMCEDWGFAKLSRSFKTRSITEMRHAETLMERILFLGGKPIVSKLNELTIGKDVENQLANDLDLETHTVEHYNDAIVLAGEVKDYATRDILMSILRDEDTHVDEIEEMQDQIEQMTLPIFLSIQS